MTFIKNAPEVFQSIITSHRHPFLVVTLDFASEKMKKKIIKFSALITFNCYYLIQDLIHAKISSLRVTNAKHLYTKKKILISSNY